MSQTRPLSCAITIGLDALSLWIGSFRSNDPGMIARGEFDMVALPRVLKLLEKYGIRSTFLVPGHTALAYPDSIRMVAAQGHEIAYHGWVHENPGHFDEMNQRQNIDRGLAALDKVLGLRPVGHVSPAWNLSPVSVDLLIEYDFLYDGSWMGSDFFPCYRRRGDSWSLDEPYQFGELTDLVGIPVAWGLDDVPIFEFVWGEQQGLAPPSTVEEIWKGDFDYAYRNCAGGIYNLTLHPQVSGRGHRLSFIDRLLEYFRSHNDVQFGPIVDYVTQWKGDNPRDEWARLHPHLTGENSIRSLGQAAAR